MGQSIYGLCASRRVIKAVAHHNGDSTSIATPTIIENIGDNPSQLFRLVNGSILDYQGEAIVNAANERCLGGGGLDGQITSAGGEAMKLERQNLPQAEPGIRCPTGQAVITSAGDGTLYHKGYVKYVIHAVGPRFHTNPTEDQWQQLTQAYDNILHVADSHQIKKIAIPLLSAGIFASGNEEQIIHKIIEHLSTCLFTHTAINDNKTNKDNAQDIDNNNNSNKINSKRKNWNKFEEVVLYGYNDNEWNIMVKAFNSLLPTLLKQKL